MSLSKKIVFNMRNDSKAKKMLRPYRREFGLKPIIPLYLLLDKISENKRNEDPKKPNIQHISQNIIPPLLIRYFRNHQSKTIYQVFYFLPPLLILQKDHSIYCSVVLILLSRSHYLSSPHL